MLNATTEQIYIFKCIFTTDTSNSNSVCFSDIFNFADGLIGNNSKAELSYFSYRKLPNLTNECTRFLEQLLYLSIKLTKGNNLSIVFLLVDYIKECPGLPILIEILILSFVCN